jgi:hypothetical protein
MRQHEGRATGLGLLVPRLLRDARSISTRSKMPAAMTNLRLSVVLIVLLSFGLACAVALASSGKGEVGGSPTVTLRPPDEGTQESPSLVFGVGSALDQRVELVAYAWMPPADSPKADFCVWVEKPPQEVEYGTCASALSSATKVISLDMEGQQLAPKSERSTVLGGRIAPDVAAVRVFLRRPGTKRRLKINAVIGRVEGDLQRRLKQPAPFGFFYAEVRGLVQFSTFKLQALDSSGNVIGVVGR